MEYIVGSLVTLAVMFILSKIIKQKSADLSAMKITFTQSRIFESIKNFVPREPSIPTMKITQSIKYLQDTSIRIFYYEGSAYWIENNQLFEANAPAGFIDESSKIIVDTVGMDKIQLNRTMFIVDKLREGLIDDSGYPGNT